LVLYYLIIIEILRCIYKENNKRTDILRKAAEEKRKAIRNKTIDDICKKFSITKKQLKNRLTTYDFQGRLLPIWKFPKEPSSGRKLKFTVNNDDTSDTEQPIEVKAIKEINGHIKNDDELKVLKLNIRPEYGVKYNSGEETLYGNEYDDNPIYNDSQMSLRRYYRLCNVGRHNQSLIETGTLDEKKNKINTILEDNELPEVSSSEKTSILKYFQRKRLTKQYLRNLEPIVKLYERKFQTTGNENGTKRNVGVTPEKLKLRLRVNSIKRFKELSPRNKSPLKLPPPPIGSTTGYGIVPS